MIILDSSSSSDVPYQISTHFSSLTHTHTMTRAPSLPPADERSISIFSSKPQNSSNFLVFVRRPLRPPFVDLDLHCPSLSLFSIPVLATLTSPHLTSVSKLSYIHTVLPRAHVLNPFSFSIFLLIATYAQSPSRTFSAATPRSKRTHQLASKVRIRQQMANVTPSCILTPAIVSDLCTMNEVCTKYGDRYPSSDWSPPPG